jgi:hypothetical protein
MDLDRLRVRAALAVALAAGTTFLLLRIALSRIWHAGAWREPPLANVIALGAVGAVGILCGALLFARPGVLPRILCAGWAVIVVILSVALASYGHDSAAIIALFAAGVGAATLPRGSGWTVRVGPTRGR